MSLSIPEKKMSKKFTEKQGRYLAFIYYYTKVNGHPPAQADIQKYFKVSPPTIHNMIVKLESSELISRKARESRSLKVLVDAKELPLEW